MKFKKIIIANWKMQLDVAESLKQAKNIKSLIAKAKIDKSTEIVLAPSFLALAEIAKVLQKSRIALAAQDAFIENKGAFTGEISLSDLKKLGCEYVIVGHSERRALGETDKIVNQKVKAVLKNQLTPIICVGETYDDRRENKQDFVVMHQVYQALHNIDPDPDQNIIIAYEPVWVIGTGQTISPKEAMHMSMVIHQAIVDISERHRVDNIDIIYGGSVAADNVHEFTRLRSIKGALVGNASLEADKFVKLIKNS